MHKLELALIEAARDGKANELSEVLDSIKAVNAKGKSTKFLDINARDNEHEPALIAAIRNGHVDIVKVLLAEDNIDVDALTQSNSGALHLALELKQEEVAHLLLDRDADPHLLTLKNENALFYAVRNNHVNITERLLTDFGVRQDLYNSVGMRARLRTTESVRQKTQLVTSHHVLHGYSSRKNK
jgi:ankyrin repeat protein